MRDQQQTLPDQLINQMRQSGTMTPISFAAPPGTDPNSVFFQQANTSTTHDIQLQITHFLKKGLLNNAFQQALCAADLNLLENLCELVPPSQAFDAANTNVKAKLQQPVILSLIQQLSQDLNSNTELKIKYLEEALVNLDLTVPLTIEHSPSVIITLTMKLQQYIQTHPSDKLIKQMRMILLASKSLTIPQKSNPVSGQSMQMNNPNILTTKIQQLTATSTLHQQQQQLTNQLKKNIMQHDNYMS